MRNPVLPVLLALLPGLFLHARLVAQDDAGDEDVKSGYLLEAPVPLDSETSTKLLAQLLQLADSAPENERVTVVVKYEPVAEDAGDETQFEDALKLARAITQPELRRLRVVALISGDVTGHSVLPVLASDKLLAFGGSSIGDATARERTADETIQLTYKSIAARRGLFPPAIVEAMADPGVELAKITTTDGKEIFATGEQLEKLRKSEDTLSDDPLCAKGVALRLEAKQLRDAKISAGTVDSIENAAEALDLASLSPIDDQGAGGKPKGVMLEIAGSISGSRTRRWQSNLTSSLESGDVNTWMIAIDSGGGDLNQSATLAGWFAQPEPPLRTVAGLIRREARGDAALIALSCDPLFMKPDATLGGPGGDAIDATDVAKYDELIDKIAQETKRPAALIRGLLDRDLVIYQYKNKKTGRIRYATEDGIVAESDDPDLERDRWIRGEQVELSAGLKVQDAIKLGLVDGEVRSLEDASRRAGLDGSPPPISDRGIVRFVERLGNSPGLAFLLLFIGFVTLSAEANAPGVSIPGFISLVCFGLYFWMKFLAGTAEWLELVLFGLGILCIAMEIFVIPGFGIFGIGGIAMVIMGVVLMSQTFVIPRNTYQIEVLTGGLWIALGSVGGLVGGFVAVRTLFPHIPLLNGLVMETPDQSVIGESEKLADFQYLAGKTGTTTTKLMPSGKARFGNDIVAVVSEGSAIGKGEEIRVVEIQGNRVVVESVNS